MRNNYIPWKKWLAQGILSFLLFQDTLLYSKVSRNRKMTKSLDFLHFHQFLHNVTKPSAAGARRDMRSVPVISVPSWREAWEVYPLEVYSPDDPTRICRPIGQSLVLKYLYYKYIFKYYQYKFKYCKYKNPIQGGSVTLGCSVKEAGRPPASSFLWSVSQSRGRWWRWLGIERVLRFRKGNSCND